MTVLDPAGAPVKDVKPADLAVSEDGATRRSDRRQTGRRPHDHRAARRQHHADDGSDAPTQELRAGLTRSSRRPRRESGMPDRPLGVRRRGRADREVHGEIEDLTKKIQRMFPTSSREACSSKRWWTPARNCPRRPGRDGSSYRSASIPPNERDRAEARGRSRCGKAGASFWAISIQSNATATTSSQGSTPTREVILAEMPATNRRRAPHRRVGGALEAQLKSIADALLSQYQLTYVRPAAGPTRHGSTRSRGAGRRSS